MAVLEDELRRCKKQLQQRSTELEQCREELALCKNRLEQILDSIASGSAGPGNTGRLKDPTPTVPTPSCTPAAAPHQPLETTMINKMLSRQVEGALMQTSLEEVIEVSERRQLSTAMWLFGDMEADETLQEHVRKQVLSGACPGPHMQGALMYVSQGLLQLRGVLHLPMAEVKAMVCGWVSTATLRREWQSSLKTILGGNCSPSIARAVFFAHPARGQCTSQLVNYVWSPAIVQAPDGRRQWGMVYQSLPSIASAEHAWAMRDLLTAKFSPACISIVDKDTGRLLCQNAASMAMFGCHGSFHCEALWRQGAEDVSDSQWEGSDAAEPSLPAAAVGTIPFLEMMLGGWKSTYIKELEEAVKDGLVFRAEVELTNPALRSLMGLQPGCEAHHDVQVCQSQDPITLQAVYSISQIDITAAVVSRRKLHQAHCQIAEDKARTEALLHRQNELVECIGWLSEVGKSSVGDERSSQLINDVYQKMVRGPSASLSEPGSGPRSSQDEGIQMLELLGQGSFGKVYRGVYRSMPVAVKSMVLPIRMSGAEKRERMAIVEAAISSSLSHPNIIKTHTYSLKPLRHAGCFGASDSRNLSTVEALGVRPRPMRAEQHGPTSPVFAQGPVRGPDPGEGTGAGPGRSRSFATENGSRNDDNDGGMAGAVSAFEVQIVQELCDGGCLRDALNRGVFHPGGLEGAVEYPAVLQVAADIARGMAHLHACNILHADLKAMNVLLQSDPDAANGFTAKVADFGLSLTIGEAETHVSNMYQGTLTHMAPETLLDGHQSNAADVYAFGITMWELFTGRLAFSGVPYALLGFQVSRDHVRPVFPAHTPSGYKNLACCCWAALPANRPTFLGVLEALALLTAMCERPVPQPHHSLNVAPWGVSRAVVRPPKGRTAGPVWDRGRRDCPAGGGNAGPAGGGGRQDSPAGRGTAGPTGGRGRQDNPAGGGTADQAGGWGRQGHPAGGGTADPTGGRGRQDNPAGGGTSDQAGGWGRQGHPAGGGTADPTGGRGRQGNSAGDRNGQAALADTLPCGTSECSRLDLLVKVDREAWKPDFSVDSLAVGVSFDSESAAGDSSVDHPRGVDWKARHARDDDGGAASSYGCKFLLQGIERQLAELGTGKDMPRVSSGSLVCNDPSVGLGLVLVGNASGSEAMDVGLSGSVWSDDRR